MEMTENKINKLEDRPREFAQSEQQAEKRLKKMNRDSTMCGQKQKMQDLYNWKRRKRVELKEYSKKYGWKFPRFGKVYKPTDSKK